MKKITKSLRLIVIAAIMFIATVACFNIDSKAAAPAQVTGLKQTAAGSRNYTISWNAALGTNIRYKIEESYDAKTWTVASSFTTTTTYTSYGKTAGCTYFVRVTAYDNTNYGNPVYGAPSAPIAVATAPESSGIKLTQTAGSSSSFSISWNAASGASGYYVYVNDYYMGFTTSTSCTITKLAADSQYTVKVFPVRVVGNYAAYYSSGYASAYAYTVMKGSQFSIDLDSWKPGTNTINLRFTKKSWNNYPAGLEVALYNTAGKKIKSYYTSSTSASIKNKKIINSACKVRIRPYNLYGGKKCFGSWSSYKVFVAQPKLNGEQLDDGRYSVTWKKIKGAKSYTLYKLNGSKLKKVGTTTNNWFIVGNIKSGNYVAKANKVKVGKKKYSTTLGNSYSYLHVYTTYSYY